MAATTPVHDVASPQWAAGAIASTTSRFITSASGALGIHFGGRDTNYDHGVCDCLIADNVISNISLDSAWGGGIRLSWGSSRNRVLRNAIDNTGRGGIFADNGSADLTICHNRVTRSGRKAEKLGLEIWKDCDRVVIEDNTIDHWLSVGGAARVAVRRNTISEKSGDVGFLGLELIGQDVVATDNLVDDGQQIGISVSNDAHNEYQYSPITRCGTWCNGPSRCKATRPRARMLYYYKNTFLTAQRGNPAAIYPNAAGRGFRFNGNCHFVTLDGNEILDNRAEGIELGGGRLDGISIVNNVIRGNAMAAVCGRAGADFEWAGNTVAGNGSNRPFASHGSLGPKPAASFRCSSSPTVGQTVNFTNTSAAAAGGLGHVLWDFGDGVPSTSFHGSHTYGRAGTYRVTLVVWDKAGRGAMKKQSITVLRGSPSSGNSRPDIRVHRIEPILAAVVDQNRAGMIAANDGILPILLPMHQIARHGHAGGPRGVMLAVGVAVVIAVVFAAILDHLVQGHGIFVVGFGPMRITGSSLRLVHRLPSSEPARQIPRSPRS